MSSLLRTYQRANQQIKRKATMKARRKRYLELVEKIKRQAQEEK